MTSQEILAANESQKTTNGWLREIAYHLALATELANRQQEPAVTEINPPDEDLCYCGKKKGHVGRHKFVEENSA